ncbi:UNVERIFIED_ORG: GMC family oxidoreductase [Bacillus sp. AZ43]
MHRDVAIVGAGAVGLVVARALAATGLSVAVIEAGTSHRARHADLRPHVSYDQQRHEGALDGWTTGLGGTTQLWGGQLWAWEDYEFEQRRYVEASPWPVTRDDLDRHYETFLRSSGAASRIRETLLTRHDAVAAGPAYTKYSAWLPWRKRNFYPPFQREFARSAGVEILAEHRVIQIKVHGSDKATVVVEQSSGDAARIDCRAVVLAAGTLGNIGLLQDSQASDSPWLGRGFMDHVSARYATFAVKNPVRFVRTAGAVYGGSSLLTPRFVMEPAYAQKHELLNAFAHWEVELPPSSPYAILREGLRSAQRGTPRIRPSDALRLLRQGPRELAFGAYCAAALRRRPLPRDARLQLRIDVEQPPRFDSAVRWSRNGGERELHVGWTIGREERAAFDTFGSDFVGSLDLDELGLEPVAVAAEPAFRDTFHMMGGTRISANVADGVVDAGLAVHGAPNVLVVGASVFPTGGVANPTMTAAALALRAAAGMKDRL